MLTCFQHNRPACARINTAKSWGYEQHFKPVHPKMFPQECFLVCPHWVTWKSNGRKQCSRNNVSQFAQGFSYWKLITIRKLCTIGKCAYGKLSSTHLKCVTCSKYILKDYRVMSKRYDTKNPGRSQDWYQHCQSTHCWSEKYRKWKFWMLANDLSFPYSH